MIRVMFYMLSFIVCVTTLTTFWFLFQAQQLMPSSSAVRNTTTINSSIPPFGYNMVVAILTAARQHPTVVGVVARLAADSSYRDYKLLAWQSYSSAHDEETRRTLEGFGVTVFTQRAVYPELLDEGRIKITWGDPLAQVKWRTNHVLDFANLLERSLTYNTDFIIMLEDDMLPAKNNLDKVYLSLRYDLPTKTNNLGYVAFFSFNRHINTRGMVDITNKLGSEGACALAFHRTLVPKLISLLRSQPYDNPVDIAFWKFMRQELNLRVFERVPNLFQHIPKESTLIRPSKPVNDMEERSSTFVYDEDNITLLLHPSDDSGYIGCFKDVDLFSDLSGSWMSKSVSESDVVSSCRTFCKDRLYLYFGLQSKPNGTIVCTCGNAFGIYGQVQESECPVCSESLGKYGKILRNAIYRVDPFNATYLGCHRDSAMDRDLPIFIGKLHKPMSCMKACSGYKYFGLQYGGECYCGYKYGDHGPMLESLCSFPCSIDSKLMCGGILANSVFKI